MDRRKEEVRKFFSKIQVPHLARKTNEPSEVPQVDSISARPSPSPLPRGLSRSNQTLASSTASLPGPGNRNTLSPEGPELIVTASSDVSPPKPPRKISKPSITLKIPTPSNNPTCAPQFPSSYRSYAPEAGMINIPLPAGATIPGSAFYEAYPNKAGEFMFKQFAGFKDFTMNTAKSGLSFGERFAFWALNKIKSWSTQWLTHVFLVLVLIAYSLLGGFIFSYTEGGVEDKLLQKARQQDNAMNKERDLVITRMRAAFLSRDIDNYTGSLYAELSNFEVKAVEHANLPKKKRWTFWGSVFYSGTVYTTIGYGNISPSTNTGRAFTIAYAIFGIPLFLIVLADFGKLFTRGIKFLWAYVRRLYYTGSCRQVRRTAAGAAPVQEVMKGVKMVVDVAQNLRRPSQMISPEEQKKMQGAFGSTLETPGPGCATPALSSYEIDEEFNLPISLALLILLVYIFCGAALFGLWESWSFFESFYFVFISMSTIGFGDVMPQHQMYMMGTIAYLLFGLALTSMCINVVQEKLTDTFRQASAKISATIGFQVEEDSGAINPVPVVPQGDLPEVHKTVKAKKT